MCRPIKPAFTKRKSGCGSGRGRGGRGGAAAQLGRGERGSFPVKVFTPGTYDLQVGLIFTCLHV
jgi:hypothetical protein